MKTFNDDDLEILEEAILEKAFPEEHYTKVIDLKDLEKILTEFFSRTINLT